MIRHLREVKLYEYGPVLFPMNEAAGTISAKDEDDPEENLPAAFLEAKEAGLGRRFGKVREAFYNDYTRFEEETVTDEGETVTSYKWYNIVDVFEKYLVVEASGALSYYKVDYSESEDGTYTFSEKSDWVEGMLEFVAKAAESKDDALNEAELALKADLEAMGREFGIITEARPEDDIPPSTSKSQEELDEEWELAHKELEETFQTWRT